MYLFKIWMGLESLFSSSSGSITCKYGTVATLLRLWFHRQLHSDVSIYIYFLSKYRPCKARQSDRIHVFLPKTTPTTNRDVVAFDFSYLLIAPPFETHTWCYPIHRVASSWRIGINMKCHEITQSINNKMMLIQLKSFPGFHFEQESRVKYYRQFADDLSLSKIYSVHHTLIVSCWYPASYAPINHTK
jgi:hypothetical protein